MNSVPELDVSPERDRHGIPTGRYVWEVYDAATGGPIKGGVDYAMTEALAKGKAARCEVESSGLYCDECDNIETLGIDACMGCCGRR